MSDPSAKEGPRHESPSHDDRKTFSRRIHAALVGIALGMTILCSCRGPSGNTAGMKLGKNGEQAYVVADQPIFARIAEQSDPAANRRHEIERDAGCRRRIPRPTRKSCKPPIPARCRRFPATIALRWDRRAWNKACRCLTKPIRPGRRRAFEQPWPEDEYLRDGGDRRMPTGVGREWQVYGLEMEDTVAHYDTVDGRRIVEPSNEVYIYSPRFGAVRQVVGLVANEQAVAHARRDGKRRAR